jgi:hypothetical protein
MPRSRLGRFMKGRHGFEKAFKRSRKLRRVLRNKKRRAYALKTLRHYQKGKGISFRHGGPGSRSELEKAYGKWRRDTEDPISKAQAKIIKKELEKYGRRLEENPNAPRASGRLLRRNSAAFGSDPRAILDRDSGGNIPGDNRGDRPSMMYGGSSFDDDAPESSGYDHQGHLEDLRGLEGSPGPFDRPEDTSEPPGHDAT